MGQGRERKRGRTFLRVGSGLVGVLFGLAFANVATAQNGPKKFDPKPSASFSNQGPHAKAKPHTAGPVEQQDVSDAVLGDTLNLLAMDKVDEHHHKGEFNHIINLYAIVVQGDPHNCDAYSNSAWLLWSSDRNDQAIAVLKKGITANPDRYDMYDELGTHYWIHLHDAQSALPY